MGRVRGLGSAKSGTSHWWHQRLSAIALIPLTIWFVVSVIVYSDASHTEISTCFASSLVSGLTMLLIVATFYHLKLGVQVVVEDYVHTEWMKTTMTIVSSASCVLLGLASILAVLKLWIGN